MPNTTSPIPRKFVVTLVVLIAIFVPLVGFLMFQFPAHGPEMTPAEWFAVLGMGGILAFAIGGTIWYHWKSVRGGPAAPSSAAQLPPEKPLQKAGRLVVVAVYALASVVSLAVLGFVITVRDNLPSGELPVVLAVGGLVAFATGLTAWLKWRLVEHRYVQAEVRESADVIDHHEFLSGSANINDKRPDFSRTQGRGTLWDNFKAMPTLLKFLTVHALACFFLLISVIPLTSYSINGRHVSYAEWWDSGAGIFASIVGIALPIVAVLFLRRSRYARPSYSVAISFGLIAPFVYMGQLNNAAFGVAVTGVIIAYLYLSSSVKAYFALSG